MEKHILYMILSLLEEIRSESSLGADGYLNYLSPILNLCEKYRSWLSEPLQYNPTPSALSGRLSAAGVLFVQWPWQFGSTGPTDPHREPEDHCGRRRRPRSVSGRMILRIWASVDGSYLSEVETSEQSVRLMGFVEYFGRRVRGISRFFCRFPKLVRRSAGLEVGPLWRKSGEFRRRKIQTSFYYFLGHNWCARCPN